MFLDEQKFRYIETEISTTERANKLVSVFWHGIDALASTNYLIEGLEYKLDYKTSLTLKSGEREWIEGKNILRLQFGLAASKFRKYAKSSGIKSLPRWNPRILFMQQPLLY